MPKILPENEHIIDIVTNYYNMLIDGMGGINTVGIIKILELEDVDRREMPILLQKISYYLSMSLLIRNEQTTT